MPVTHEPSWDKDSKSPKFPSLQKDLTVDIVIIGGGITGITCAYLLSTLGKRVVLVEKNKLGTGATGVTTALLTQVIDTDFTKLERMVGRATTKKIFESHAEAITTIETIVRKEGIECEFVRCSNYAYANSPREFQVLQKEYAKARSLGLSGRMRDDTALNFNNAGYIELPKQAKFHPLKYCFALARRAALKGVSIFEHTEVQDIEEGERFVLKTPKGTVTAENLIMATHAPMNKKLFFKKSFYDSYVIEARIPSGVLKEGIYEDNEYPYHYFRVDRKRGKDRLIIGGEDHRSDITVSDSKNFRALEGYMKKTFSHIPYEITRKWKGPIIEPVDGLSFIGKLDHGNIFYATGFSGNGMTYGTIAAMIIHDLLMGKKNAWGFLYDAARTPTLWNLAEKGIDYSREFVGGAVKNTLRYKKK